MRLADPAAMRARSAVADRVPCDRSGSVPRWASLRPRIRWIAAPGLLEGSPDGWPADKVTVIEAEEGVLIDHVLDEREVFLLRQCLELGEECGDRLRGNRHAAS